MFNEVSLRILYSFAVALIILFFVVYINQLRYHRLFDLLLCAIFLIILLPPLLLCPPSSSYLDHQMLLLSPSLSSCTFFNNQRIISSHATPTYPPPPISPPPVDYPKLSYLISPMCLFSKTNSWPSSALPSITSSSINLWSSPSYTFSSITSCFLSTISPTHDILKTDIHFQESKLIANQFSVIHSDLRSPFRKTYIIEGFFSCISRKISHSLTWIAVYCHHRHIYYQIFQIKGFYRKRLYPCQKYIQQKRNGAARKLQSG